MDPNERQTLLQMKTDGATEDEKAEQSGLMCKKCGCHNFRVNYTRPKAGAIMRRRICRNCGTALITWERPAFH